MHNYKSSNIEIVGREGMMFNEATLKTIKIPYEHYGILANDNTYAVTFDPYMNQPVYTYFEYYPLRRPTAEEHKTKTATEPPVALTDGNQYMHKGYVQPTPLLPPYLNRPEDLGLLQGRAKEFNKADIVYGPKHKVHITNIVY